MRNRSLHAPTVGLEARRCFSCVFRRGSGSSRKPILISIFGQAREYSDIITSSLTPIQQSYELALEEETPTRDNYRELKRADGFFVAYALCFSQKLSSERYSAMNRDTLSPLMEYLYMLTLATHASVPCVVVALGGGPTAIVSAAEGEAMAKQQSCLFLSVRAALDHMFASIIGYLACSWRRGVLGYSCFESRRRQRSRSAPHACNL